MKPLCERALLDQLLEIYDQKYIASFLAGISPRHWSREVLNRCVKDQSEPAFSSVEYESLRSLLPEAPVDTAPPAFRFVDLFAGIGGIRRAFDQIGGQCVFTSEWNAFARRTYKANYWSSPELHVFNHDIREVTLTGDVGVSESTAYRHIDKHIPDHDVLLAGFPCQPFSIAGVSKKNALGRAHGFECKTQGTLFFDVARIIQVKRPAAFLLENVKNLKSHDQGRTFGVIMETLDELGYEVADAAHMGAGDPKIIDAKHFVPQHRERIVLVGFRRDLGVHKEFSLRAIASQFPHRVPPLSELLDARPDTRFILTPKLWEYLFNYAEKHKRKGNGFGFGLVSGESTTRTLSARYYKDGSEILIDRGWDFSLPFKHPINQLRIPRRLTPRECARLMGFDRPSEAKFRIPVSDTQAYRQFGNSVAVPVFEAVARLMLPPIVGAVSHERSQTKVA